MKYFQKMNVNVKKINPIFNIGNYVDLMTEYTFTKRQLHIIKFKLENFKEQSGEEALAKTKKYQQMLEVQ